MPGGYGVCKLTKLNKGMNKIKHCPIIIVIFIVWKYVSRHNIYYWIEAISVLKKRFQDFFNEL